MLFGGLEAEWVGGSSVSTEKSVTRDRGAGVDLVLICHGKFDSDTGGHLARFCGGSKNGGDMRWKDPVVKEELRLTWPA